MPHAAEFLVKAVVPSVAKASIARDLSSLGISRTSLFPDIENLALVIRESIKRGIALHQWGVEEANP
jgi:hypothetical protein